MFSFSSIKQHPDELPLIAGWHHQEWCEQRGFVSGRDDASLKLRIKKLEKHLEGDFLPSTWLARIQQQTIGSVSLVSYGAKRDAVMCWSARAPQAKSQRNGLPLKKNYPLQSEPVWLANLYVAPVFRNQGIGAGLVKHAAEEAQSRGVRQLKLFTLDRRSFYERLGWRYTQEIRIQGKWMSVLSLNLAVSRQTAAIQYPPH